MRRFLSLTKKWTKDFHQHDEKICHCRFLRLNLNVMNAICGDVLCSSSFRPELKDPSQSPPFPMPSKLLILHGEAKSYCFTVSCVPESMFHYL